MTHRRQPNRRKQTGLGFVLAATLIVFLTTAFAASPARSVSRSAAATLATAHTAGATTTTPLSPDATKRHVVLVVGDSVIAQSQAQLRDASNSNVTVHVASEPGSAPCDWTAGRFDSELAAVRPDIVVLAFVGNAGLTASCVSTQHAFPLTELLSNYRLNLTTLANRATAAGATVIFVTPPARNPATPPPPETPTIGELAAPDRFYGFQGVPAIRDLYAEMTAGSNGRWQRTDAPALAISPGFVYKQFLSCDAGDGSCPDGFVAVRKGRDDAIHLDAGGNGARRYARALIASTLAIADKTSRA